MDFREIKRINETLKMLREFQELRKRIESVNQIQRQREMIRQFIEERKDQFWRGGRPSEEELENLREKAGYDSKLWAEIVRELLGEPAPRDEKKSD